MPRLLSALAGALLTTTLLAAAPADAAGPYTPPALSGLDTGTPGHVTGTISTSAPYVLVQLGRSAGGYLANPVYLTTAAGSAGFDLDAWGYTGDDLQLTAAGCARAEFVDCDPPVTFDQVFQLSDVQPTVTFPTDTTVGPGEGYALSVSDPQGGGRLFAIWQNHEIPISRTGSTTLPTSAFVDGTGDLEIWRCTDHPPNQGFIYPCVETGISRSLAVDRTVSSTGTVSPSTIGPGASSVTLNTSVSDTGTYVLRWEVRNAASSVVASGQSSPTAIGPTTTKAFTLGGLPSLPSGSYSVVATMSRASTAGNDFVSTVTGSPSFQVDTVAPTVTGVTAATDTLFPAVDGYRDTTTVTISGQAEQWLPAAVQVRNAFGDAVRTLSVSDFAPGDGVATATWDGTDASSTPVPAGVYTLYARATDGVGNTSAWLEGSTLTVDSRKLTTLTWSKSVSATDSLVKSSVGRCSVLRRPSAHLWAESIGLLSGYRCRSTTSANLLVSTQHSVTLPAVASPGGYRTFAVSTYGGAARTKPTSTGSMRYYSNTNASGIVRSMSAKVGYHAASPVGAASLVRSDRSVRWGTYTSAYRQYDVKHFLVTLTYTALR